MTFAEADSLEEGEVSSHNCAPDDATASDPSAPAEPERRHLIFRLLGALWGVTLFVLLIPSVGLALLPAFDCRAMVVTSGSMEPAFGGGDVAVVCDTAASELVVGDVITFGNENGTLTTHRVIDVQQIEETTWFETQGDANETPDATLIPEQVIEGRVVQSIPWIGRLLAYLSGSNLFYLALGGWAIVLAVRSTRSLVAAWRHGGAAVAATVVLVLVGMAWSGTPHLDVTDAVMTDTMSNGSNTFSTGTLP